MLLILGLAALVNAPQASAAAGDLPVTLNLPSSATVNGQLAGTGGVENTTAAPVTLNGFRITPSCRSTTDGPAPYCRLHAEFDVLSVASAVGQVGTACAGTVFVADPPSVGLESFPLRTSDNAEFELAAAGGPLSSCVIDVTFNVLKVPVDADPAMPGAQTFLYARVFKPGFNPPEFAIAGFTVVAATAPASVALQAPATGTVGGPIAATATVTPSDPAPTGTVAFSLFGPTDASCTGPPLATTQAAVVQGDGTAPSEPFTPATPGTYHWIAAYSGDANLGDATTACGDPGTTTEVAKATTTLGLVASPSVAPGQEVFATATLAGGTSPTGSITFRAWSNNPACEGPPDLTSTAAVTGAGDYASNHFSSTLAGTYRFTASYSGDATNSVFETTCDAPGASVIVATAEAVLPTITLSSGTTNASLSAPGGTFTFNLTVGNTSAKPVTIKTLTDSVYGDLAGRGSCKAGVVLTAAPGPGDTYSCSYDGAFSGAAGATQKATVKVSALDEAGNEATASHDTAVSLTAAAAAATGVTTGAPAAAGTGNTGSGGAPAGALPRTGAGLANQVRLGLALLLTGLLLTRRRQQRPEPAVPVLTRPW